MPQDSSDKRKEGEALNSRQVHGDMKLGSPQQTSDLKPCYFLFFVKMQYRWKSFSLLSMIMILMEFSVLGPNSVKS